MRKVICIAAISEGKILLVRKKLTWILPGGKPEKTESDQMCLVRELGEELPKTTILDVEYYNKFTGITPHSKREIQAIVYIGNVVGKINPSAEVNKAKWIKTPEKYNLSDISKEIIRSLRKTGHL